MKERMGLSETVLWAAVGPAGKLAWWRGTPRALTGRIQGQAPTATPDTEVMGAVNGEVAAYAVDEIDAPDLPPNRIANRMIGLLDEGAGVACGYVAFTGTLDGPRSNLDGKARTSVVQAWQQAVAEADRRPVPTVPTEVEDVADTEL